MQAKEACSHAVKIYTTCLGESHELCKEQKPRMRTLRYPSGGLKEMRILADFVVETTAYQGDPVVITS